MIKKIEGKLSAVEGPHTWSRERGYKAVDEVERLSPAEERRVEAALARAAEQEKSEHEQAVAKVMAKGYDRAAAEKIVDQHGVEDILAG